MRFHCTKCCFFKASEGSPAVCVSCWELQPGRKGREGRTVRSRARGMRQGRPGRAAVGRPLLPPARAVLPLHPGPTGSQPQRNPALGGQGGPQICLWGSSWRNQCAGQIRLPKGSKGFPGEKKKERKTTEKREERELGEGERLCVTPRAVGPGQVILDLGALADPVMASPRLLSFAVPVPGSTQGLTTAISWARLAWILGSGVC